MGSEKGRKRDCLTTSRKQEEGLQLWRSLKLAAFVFMLFSCFILPTNGLGYWHFNAVVCWILVGEEIACRQHFTAQFFGPMLKLAYVFTWHVLALLV